MKKSVLFLGLLIASSINIFAQQKGKVARPDFQITKLEIICCQIKRTNTSKVVHVEYNNAAAGMKMRVQDNVGNLIGDYPISGGDYLTPCINLADSTSYKISWIDSAGTLMAGITPVTKLTPKCGLFRVKNMDTKVTPIPKND